MKERTTICIDVGNTETHLGLFADGELESAWALTTPAHATADELFMQICNLGLASITDEADAIMACVVPELSGAWETALSQLSCVKRPYVVGPGLKNGLLVKTNDPTEVGADRIADCVAAKEIYGAPVIVVDLGTTTNINVIDDSGALQGSIIAPGMRTSATAAFSAAAQLHAVTIAVPGNVIGKTTRESMQSGIILGEACRIRGLISLVEEELGYPCQILLTGSDAPVLKPLMERECAIDENLTLRGLHLICQKNAKRH